MVKLLAVPNARLASCVVEWRIHLSTALVQKALLSLRNANKQMCSIKDACCLDALKYLSTLYCNFRKKRFFCKLLSSWFYQCQLACILLPDGPAGSELHLLEEARAVSFRDWSAMQSGVVKSFIQPSNGYLQMDRFSFSLSSGSTSKIEFYASSSSPDLPSRCNC